MEQPEHRQHSRACRKRFYDRMKEDPDELYRLNWNETRMGRDAARADEIPCSPGPVGISHAAKGGGGDDSYSAPTPQANAPISDADEFNPGGAEIPAEDDDSMDDIKIGHVEEHAEQQDAPAERIERRVEVEDEEMRDEPPWLIMSDDEEMGPAGPY